MSTLPDPALPWPLPLPAVALIAEREGCRLRAYRCPAGVWTCGWGETSGVTPETVWDQAEADRRFCASLTRYTAQVLAMCTEHPAPNQLGALVSLAYNVGPAALQRSTVLAAHNRGDWQSAARAFSLWDKARVAGALTVLPGLTARRAAEAALYLTPEPDAPREPMPQAVEPETKIATSPIAQGGTVTAGTAAAWIAAQLESLQPLVDKGKHLLVETLGIPPQWLPWIVVGVAGAMIVRHRLRQRAQGWA